MSTFKPSSKLKNARIHISLRIDYIYSLCLRLFTTWRQRSGLPVLSDRGSDNIMRLLSTHVFGDHVQLRFESTLPSGEAIEWMEIWVKHETDECQPLATIQREALERAQNVINSEIQRLRSLAGLGVRQ